MNITARGKQFEVAPAGHEVFWKELTSGVWEPETFAIFERFLSARHSYIDIGAWIGPTLLYGCQLAKAAYALEPDPLAYRELQGNVALNSDKTANVFLFNACIAMHSGEVALGSRGAGGDSTSSLIFAKKKTHWTVKAFTFADFIQQNGITDCNFIKIDIEGAEYQILPQMSEYLRAHRPTLHLSLHPCYLKLPLLGWPGRIISRLWNTFKIVGAVKFYRHIYDHHGRELTAKRVLWLCLAKISLDIVLTDQEWR